MLRRNVTGKACFLLLLAICVLCATWTFNGQRLPSSDWNASTARGSDELARQNRPVDSNIDAVCAVYPDDGKIAVSVKTGATEVFKKLPSMLNTSIACIRDVMVFSDLEQRLGDLLIHDALSRFSREAMEGNPDFEIYWKQRELKAKGREHEIESLSGMLAPARDSSTAGKVASWGLDKYKFIHMLEMAYELQHGRDWYVFVEADTYLSWPNLKRWLNDLNPKDRLYFGNAMQKSGRPPKYFAHGGAGFVLSGAALKELAIDRKGAASRTDEHAHKWWAGDMMLADVLNRELSIQVADAAPLFNHIDKDTLEAVLEDVSRPAITVHRVAAEEFEQLHQREDTREPFGLLLSDVYGTLPSARKLLEDFTQTIAIPP